MRATLILLALALPGCSNVEAGDEAGGVITSSAPPSAVQASADAHCGRYGKVARIGALLSAGRRQFDCVAAR
jgi:hypothetical protein